MIIKNGKLITDEVIDVEIVEGIITKVSKDIEINENEEVIDLKGEKYISAGWIDVHTHCFNKYKLYSDDPDEIGYKKGVTTVVDAGTVGADTVEEFYNNTREKKTNVYCFLNIAKTGIVEQDELADLSRLDKNALKEAYNKYSDFVVGIKARMSKTVIGNNGIKPLDIALEAAEENDLPLMVHIGSNPPELKDVFDRVRPGDMIAHIFNGKKNGILDENGEIRNFVKEAYSNGVIFDLAHGTDSFNFGVTKKAFDENIYCHCISTDIYCKNRINGPVYELATTMSKLLLVGYTKEQIIDKVTKEAAKAIRKDNIGEIKVGAKADFTIFTIDNIETELIDSNKNVKISNEIFKPVDVIINGKYIKL